MKKLLFLLFLLTGFSAPGFAQATYFSFDSLAAPPYICQAHVLNVNIYGMVADGSVQLSSQNNFVSQDTVYVRAYFVAGVGTAMPYPLNLHFTIPAPGIGLYKIVAQGFYQGQLHRTITSQIAVCSALTGVPKTKNQGLRLKVYPNPVQEKLKITVPAARAEALLLLVDNTGENVLAYKIAPGNSLIQVDLSGVAPGLYLLQYQTGQTRISEKIWKR